MHVLQVDSQIFVSFIVWYRSRHKINKRQGYVDCFMESAFVNIVQYRTKTLSMMKFVYYIQTEISLKLKMIY